MWGFQEQTIRTSYGKTQKEQIPGKEAKAKTDP